MKHPSYFSSHIKLIPISLAVLFFVAACSEESSSTSGENFGNNDKDTKTNFDQGKLVASIVDNVITPTYQQFSGMAELHQQALDDYCTAEKNLAQGDGSETLVIESKSIAQQSWRNAINTWQQADMMQLPPLLIGEGALRNNIYSWPTENSCGVDLDVTYFKAGAVNGKSYNIATRTASRKSLLAVEYLLFNDNLDHSCTGTTVPEQWNNQTESYRKIARCEYASEVASDVKRNADKLINAWLGNDGKSGYAAKLKLAGTQGSDFATAHDAVNEISDAIFYLDSYTKDGKLAKPLGIFANECGAQACQKAVESKYSQHSITHVSNNLLALKMFMQGSLTAEQADALGFRDYLVDVGDEFTANAIDEHIALAIEDTQAYESSLANTLVDNPNQVLATHTEVKNITDKLKSDFITSLALELPKTSAGDND